MPQRVPLLTRVDTSARPQIARLTHMLREGSRLEDPARMLAHYGAVFGMGEGPRRDMLVTVSKRGLPEGKYKITRLMVDTQRLDPDAPDLPNPWRDWERLQVYEGGFIGEVIAREEPQLIVGLDLTDDPIVGDRLSGMRSALITPNFDEGRAINWALQFSKDDSRWSIEDLERWMISGNLLGTATRNLVTRRSVDELNRRLEHQFDEVARVQRSLLPEATPKIPGYSIATSYLTSLKAGGDYYDFYRFDEHEWGIMIADVSGHGAAAATVMAMLHAMLPEPGDPDATPKRIVPKINRRLVNSLHEGMFVTALFVHLNTITGEFAYVRCGHPPARVRRGSSGTVEPLVGVPLLPMGIVDEYEVETASARLDPGDTLILYTDGITEEPRTLPDASREMFGVERLDAALRGCTGEPTCVVDSIHHALHEHTGAMTREDDQTLVVVRREPDA
ncbi:MAG: PP2C family protein-serine/threonine phosphatase [Phycisphaerales bacterium]